MQSWKWVGVVAFIGAIGLCEQAEASCYAFVGPPGDSVTNSDSSVIVAYDGDEHTYVTMAADAHGDGASFGYVLPVPAGFSVADAVLVDPAAYDGLHGFMAPRRVTTTCAEAAAPTNGVVASGCGGSTGFAPAGLPVLSEIQPDDTLVAEHRTLGAYDLTVLEPRGSQQLQGWLDDHGFALSEASEPMVDALIDEGIWFLAVDVDGGAGEGWVEPLRLRYDGHMNSLPLALGATSSRGVQDLVVLVIDDTDSAARISNYPQAEHETDCMIEGDLEEAYDARVDAELLEGSDGRALWSVEAVLGPEDTWAGETEHDLIWLEAVGSTASEDAVMTRLHLRYTPDQIHEDLLLKREDAEVLRSTYITYDPQLESTYPICGEGFVTEDPGECPETVAPVDSAPGTTLGGEAASGTCTSVPIGVPWTVLVLLGALARRRQ